MNKEQYMKALKKRLRHLPKREYDKAIEYFEEYFAEAGTDQEQQAIQDLGMPEEAAEQIIQDIAVKNMQNPVKDVRHGMSAVWIGILAVFAVPVGLPVLMVALLAVFLLFLAVMMIFVVLMVTGIAGIIAGPVSFLGGFAVFTRSIPAAFICFGQGFLAIGIGILMVWGMYLLIRKFMNWLVRLFGNMVKKGGRTNE